ALLNRNHRAGRLIRIVLRVVGDDVEGPCWAGDRVGRDLYRHDVDSGQTGRVFGRGEHHTCIVDADDEVRLHSLAGNSAGAGGSGRSDLAETGDVESNILAGMGGISRAHEAAIRTLRDRYTRRDGSAAARESAGGEWLHLRLHSRRTTPGGVDGHVHRSRLGFKRHLNSNLLLTIRIVHVIYWRPSAAERDAYARKRCRQRSNEVKCGYQTLHAGCNASSRN